MSFDNDELKKRTRSNYSYFLTYRTRWSDNDQYSHINNSVYYYLFDSIVNTYLITHCGLAPSPSTSSSTATSATAIHVQANPVQIGLVLTSHSSFFRPLSFPQILQLGLRVVNMTQSTASYEIGVFAEGDDTVSVVGGYTHVFVDRDTRRAGKDGMGRELRRGLKKLLKDNALEEAAEMDDRRTKSKL